MTGDAQPGPARAWALAIETSNPSSAPEGTRFTAAAGAVWTAGGGASGDIVEAGLPEGSRHDDGLFVAIDRVRAELGVEAGALRRVCVSIGPGGYTGLRVAATIARTLAIATGCEVVGVPSARVVAAALAEAGEADLAWPLAVCLASKRESTHATVFAGPDEAGREAGLIAAADVPRLGASAVAGDRFLPASVRAAAEAAGLPVVTPRFGAGVCLRIGLGLGPTPASELVPVYAREAEAVRLWRERG